VFLRLSGKKLQELQRNNCPKKTLYWGGSEKTFTTKTECSHCGHIEEETITKEEAAKFTPLVNNES